MILLAETRITQTSEPLKIRDSKENAYRLVPKAGAMALGTTVAS